MSIGRSILESISNSTIKEAEDTRKERKIPIGLKDEKTKDILNAVVGQLSDGIWENSPGMERYWRFTDGGDGKGNIIVYNGYERNPWYNPRQRGSGNPWFYSAFNDMDDDAVKRYFAHKIKQIVKEEGLEWKRDNTEPCTYLDYDSGVTVRDAYKVYDRLLGRIDRITEGVAMSKDDPNFKELVIRDFQLFMEDKYDIATKRDLARALENVTEDDINEYFTGMFYEIFDTEDLESANEAEKIIRDRYYAMEDIEEEGLTESIDFKELAAVLEKDPKSIYAYEEKHDISTLDLIDRLVYLVTKNPDKNKEATNFIKGFEAADDIEEYLNYKDNYNDINFIEWISELEEE